MAIENNPCIIDNCQGENGTSEPVI